MTRWMTMLPLVAACMIAAPAAQAQTAVVGDSHQSSGQSISAKQKGGSSLNSHNAAGSTQAADSDLILGDVDQRGQQDVSSSQSGGKVQNTENSAANQQSVGGAGGPATAIIGNTSQHNAQGVSSTQSLKKGVENAKNTVSNAQLIATDLVLGATGQANEQHVVTSQTAKSGPNTSTTILIVGFGTIKIPGDLPTVTDPNLVINPDGSTTKLSAQVEISNSQVILGG